MLQRHSQNSEVVTVLERPLLETMLCVRNEGGLSCCRRTVILQQEVVLRSQRLSLLHCCLSTQSCVERFTAAGNDEYLCWCGH